MKNYEIFKDICYHIVGTKSYIVAYSPVLGEGFVAQKKSNGIHMQYMEPLTICNGKPVLKNKARKLLPCKTEEVFAEELDILWGKIEKKWLMVKPFERNSTAALLAGNFTQRLQDTDLTIEAEKYMLTAVFGLPGMTEKAVLVKRLSETQGQWLPFVYSEIARNSNFRKLKMPIEIFKITRATVTNTRTFSITLELKEGVR